jgi:hypothetical protein
MTTTNTLHTPRFLLPVPTWNADWQKWQQTFETFANGVDSSLFSLLEHVTLIPRVLPTVSIAGGVFSQSGPAQFISRTLQVEVGVGPNPLTLVPRALVCAHLQSGAVGPQSIEWELRITNTEVDADLVVFGVVGDDYSITWYNGSRLVPGTPMALFAFPGTGGGGGLSPAPFDWVFAPTLLTVAQNGQYFVSIGTPFGNGDITLPASPTAGMQFTIMARGGGIKISGSPTSPIMGPGPFAGGVLALAMSNESAVTLTCKDMAPFAPGVMAWVMTAGVGQVADDADPTSTFNFNFNAPTSFPTDATGTLLGITADGIVQLGTDLYGTKRAGSQQHSGGTAVDVGPTDVWKLIESGRNDATGISPVVCTLDGFAWLNDDGWECEFQVGVDAAYDTVPMTVKTPPFTTDICIQGSRYVNSITCADVGGYVRLRWAPWGLGRGHFIVTGGRGTWTDDLGGIHQLTGGGGGAGSLQDAYDGGALITIPVGGDPVGIQNEQAGQAALRLSGTGPQRIEADAELELADGSYAGVEGPPDAVPLSSTGARDFIFPCSSLIDGINQAYLSAGAVAWSGQTSNDTPAEIFVGGVPSERHAMPEGSTTAFQLTAIARDNVGNRSKVWTITAVAQVSIGGTPSWVSVASPAYAVVDQSDSSGGTDDWDIAVALNTPDRTFRVTVTGQTSTTIQWAVFRR